ncbi:hypothetical protein CAPTEDRAFT_153905 [Capitella teleta]|uniref:Beta-Casp domain-containing protein n=1 Tax=Capitella teleta TaxID=283909 RepID=R7U1W2_CAPTE|nr:hypothetical protein CAPTEDRAFT_153905 [Capitella teleta]|eukprot:ELT97170.1 hypothetical protein CAPTEDRAFT_153905 [Capitella teleta]
MKLYCLSGHTSRPCFVLRFKGTTIMLDCSLDVSTLLHFLPLPLIQGGRLCELPGWSPAAPGAQRLDEELCECSGRVFVDSEPEFAIPELDMMDMSEVDVLLISNYHCMMALPFLTEYTNFRGVVYATEPTLHLGRLYMEELVDYIQQCPSQKRASKWKRQLNYLPPPLREAIRPSEWRQIYSKHDIDSSLAKICCVGFNEIKDIFGALKATPVSSGYAIGSCNWILTSHHHKISYLSGTSTLTTHPRPMEKSPLKDSDILIMSSLTQIPMANPDVKIGEFCVNAATTLKNGGNVLVPCYPSGITYDLFECLSSHLDTIGLGGVPLYFISPVAASSLAYSNIYAEWLSSGKQSKVYLPEPPFPHAELIRSNRLKHYPGLHEGFNKEIRSPCIVFTGHPSLRFGNVVHFLEIWGKSSSNTIIFTEPDFGYLEALAPHQPLHMKVSYCPIDTSLSFSQANKLIRELHPQHIVTPDQYTAPPVMMPHCTDLVIDPEYHPLTFKKAEVLTLPIKREFEQLDLDPQLAESLRPTEVRPGLAVAMLSGSLVSRDNHFKLTPAFNPVDNPLHFSEETKPSPLVKPVTSPTYLWGNLDVFELRDSLHQKGLMDAKVENVPNGFIIHIPSEDTLIQIDQTSTHIMCSNEILRNKIKESLIKCLAKI